jgi:multiple sugar transport system substrate-binding protein
VTTTPSGPQPTVTVPFELPVTIAISGRFGDALLSILDGQIATFEATNPDIQVEIIRAKASSDERREQFSADLDNGETTVDVYVLDDSWLAEFAAGGWMVTLDLYIQASGLEMDDFLPATVQASVVNGQIMALPWTADGGLVYYRQDLLAQSGYSPPEGWPELQTLALETRAQGNLPYGFVWQGAPYESLTCNTLEYVWANGGDVLDSEGLPVFDSPQTRAALQQMEDLLASGASPEEVTDFGEAQSLEVFQEGDAALMRNWSFAWAEVQGSASDVAGQVGVAPLPVPCLLGQSLVLSAHSMHPEQAFRFMAFLTGYDQQLHLAQQLGQPPALEAAYHDAELLVTRPVFTVLYAALANSKPRPQTPQYVQVSEAIYTEVNAMLGGGHNAAETAANVQRRLEAILGER